MVQFTVNYYLSFAHVQYSVIDVALFSIPGHSHLFDIFPYLYIWHDRQNSPGRDWGQQLIDDFSFVDGNIIEWR